MANVPQGYHTVTPYLVVPGAAKLVQFLKDVFGATEKEMMAQPDGTVMHAEMRIGDSVVMMGDASGENKPMPAMLYVYVDDCDAVYQRALAMGATSVRDPQDQFYGDRNAGVADMCGNQWWLAQAKEQVPADEMARRVEDHMKK